MSNSKSEHSDQPEERSFNESTVRLLELYKEGSPRQSDDRDLAIVLDGLSRFLGSRFQSLSPAEISDIASESLTRLLQASQTGQLQDGRPAGPYLTRIAHNLAVSGLRRPPTAELNEAAGAGLDDDDLARLLDARASADRLRAALAIAAAKGDHMLIRVVRVWLQLAQKHSAAPNSREVGGRLGVSHTTVNEALARLRAYLPE